MVRVKPVLKDWEARVKTLRKNYEASISTNRKEQIHVYTRCVFDRVFEINTKDERFDADVIIDSSWESDDVLKILLMPQLTKDYSSTFDFLPLL
jgi:hypothetical protein